MRRDFLCANYFAEYIYDFIVLSSLLCFIIYFSSTSQGPITSNNTQPQSMPPGNRPGAPGSVPPISQAPSGVPGGVGQQQPPPQQQPQQDTGSSGGPNYPNRFGSPLQSGPQRPTTPHTPQQQGQDRSGTPLSQQQPSAQVGARLLP